ncbi:hypothetical protein QCA50_020548 [Cerrena zonata]|uniref:F-box domain-containing protein n=1 Tax=Cerrena zonata TaxID=2478898 RepID=A0AAW0FCZ4_9APHY
MSRFSIWLGILTKQLDFDDRSANNILNTTMNGIPRIGELENELDEMSRLVLSAINTEDQVNRLLDEQRVIVKELQARVVKHNCIIAAIQARRNAFAPRINSILLPELLAEVFLQLTIMYANDNSTPTNHYGWLRVAHVCRYWRDVMVAHPRLFSCIRIPTREPCHLTEIVRLSAASELKLHIACTKSDHPGLRPCWEAVDHLLPRTRHLKMDVEAPDIWPHCPRMVSFIWMTNGPFEASKVHSVIASMPNLLRFSSATKTLGAEWLKLPLATTLTELRLDHTVERQCNASLNELGKLLATLTSLKTLDFQMLREFDYSLPTSTPVSCPPLPHLTTLRLSGVATGVKNVLRLPFRATMVDISAGAGHNHGHLVLLPISLVELLRRDSPDHPKSELCTCTMFLVRSNNRWNVNIHAWDEGRVPDRDTPTLRFLASFTSTSTTAFFETHSVLMHGLRPVLVNTRRLILRDFAVRAVNYTPVWHAIFSCLKNIVSLKFIVFPTNPAAINGPDIFTMVSILMTMDERGVMCLHRLQELCITFSGVVPHRDFMLGRLQQSLSLRLSSRRQLNTLIIDESLISNEDDRIGHDIVESLSSVVGDLIRT